MQHEVTSIIAHMAKSHCEMARMLEAKRQSITNMAHIVSALPNEAIEFGGTELIATNSVDLTKNVSAYLSSLADLADAIGDHLELVIKELAEQDEE
ncbi:nucleoside-diphosphate sugar epimerase [Paenibacillus ginsengarvi]|uniref:Nucleoside-diphosphate sugar epimerase n=1 Tax=Paenibacillus ginsengarvi TaxID=400777 RepID=A0A3B0CLU6_9BACL|nr:nucleoside-diphosphate sugar epimerase [Paenibacillus ginsengarvi]RKN85337.1 nucleoside-diphosphate sugar epimerase [Paenibacillus ginsengarvi]